MTGIPIRMIVISTVLVAAFLLTSGKALAQPTTCTPEPTDMTIALGDRVTCDINPIGDLDVFRFNGVAGETVLIQVTRQVGPGNPCFELFDPNGAQIGRNCINLSPERGEFPLPATGTYMLRVFAFGNNSTLPYELFLQRVVPPASVARIGFLQPLNGEISHAGELDFYQFNGTAGDTIIVQVTRQMSPANPCFELFDPTGAQIGGSCINLSPARGEFLLTATGTYSIRVFAFGHNSTLPYSIFVQCIGQCRSAPCIYSLSPTSRVFPADGGPGTVGVVTTPDCPWSASSNDEFLTFTGDASGIGRGTLSYSVESNPSATARTGSLSIADQSFTVTQSGTAPLFLISPDRLSFSESAPANQLLSVLSESQDLTFTVTVSTTTGGDWLAANPVAGEVPSIITVAADAAGLEEGTYEGVVSVVVPNAGPDTRDVPVTLGVFEDIIGFCPPEPDFFLTGVDPNKLTFSFVAGVGGPTQQTLTATGTSPCFAGLSSDNIAISGGDWLTVSGGGSTLLVQADPSGLPPGTYTGRIIISVPDRENIVVPVTMTIARAQQSILLSQTGLTFTAVAEGGPVPPQTFGVLNTGQGVMQWSVSASTLSDGPDWLSVTPAGGSSDASALNVPLLQVSADPAELPAGEYYGQVQVTSPLADNSPQSAAIVLNVLPPGSDPGPIVRPTGLIFAGIAGGSDPDLQTVLVSNLTSLPKMFNSFDGTFDGADWFVHQPTSGVVEQALEIQGRAQIADLAPDIRRGVLAILFRDGRFRTVNLLFVLISSPNASQALPTVAQNLCNPTKLLPVFTSLTERFNVSAAWPIPIETRVVDDCGNPLSEGLVTATFSNGDPSLSLVSLRDGRWSGTWQARNTDLSQVTIKILSEIPGTDVRGEAVVTGGLSVNQTPPQVGAGAVVNAASFAQATPLAPGSIVSIFGERLSEVLASSRTLPLATELGGTTITVGGRPLPLLFTSQEQVNAMVPYDIVVNTQHQVLVRRAGTLALPEVVTVASAGPAIFTKDQTGKGQGVILDTNFRFVEPGNAAKAGDAIVIFCAGLGDVDPPVEAGTAAPSSPLSKTRDTPLLTLGGVEAQVLFSGLAPDFTGLYQVNALVPQGVTPGEAVAVVLRVAGQESLPVTVAVQ